jgi:hypothetical protein
MAVSCSKRIAHARVAVGVVRREPDPVFVVLHGLVVTFPRSVANCRDTRAPARRRAPAPWACSNRCRARARIIEAATGPVAPRWTAWRARSDAGSGDLLGKEDHFVVRLFPTHLLSELESPPQPTDDLDVRRVEGEGLIAEPYAARGKCETDSALTSSINQVTPEPSSEERTKD